ncbi:orotidine-5'-phosphate decarboxylase [Devosia sp. Root635]|uniref:orotidine-5'-phosphate decarboxylase n=1 Tax=Devosia sp. Root635 TaxID=1736575 RepID=UPI000A6C31E1|nr:orotidine-5'-phosphate decarboxylase [Devosia sp. Root635]
MNYETTANASVSSPVSMPFWTRFATASRDLSPFCLGVDPSREVLAGWGLDADIDGLRRFCDEVLACAREHVAVVKPQVAFFEAFGPAGMETLQSFMRDARAAGLLVIADAKRGDVGSTMDAYGQAWLGDDAPFACDAVTISPYLGLGAYTGFLERAADSGTGVFVVVRSSNPEAAELQDALINGKTIADHLAVQISAFNQHRLDRFGNGPVGAVVGATLGAGAAQTIAALPTSLFLVPGLGAQGATFADVAAQFGDAVNRAVPSASRSILSLGKNPQAFRGALERHVEDARRIMRLA